MKYARILFLFIIGSIVNYFIFGEELVQNDTIGFITLNVLYSYVSYKLTEDEKN